MGSVAISLQSLFLLFVEVIWFHGRLPWNQMEYGTAGIYGRSPCDEDEVDRITQRLI
ncbi:hypothetical protein J6590_076209 [Homalodisca vitripennis]|nr:hypothetical protein J6590_076209 [Homalodisca vitripennis]